MAIMVIGIFLRSYNFHNWLDFGSDQVNDAERVGAVVEGQAPWPAYGPDMGSTGTGGRANRFRLGPMYYDFEIISAKIFGNKPDAMAYPDLLFGILSIPLFYYFLRRIFSPNLSLSLTGLYAISFYALSFSHSAWNVNSISFWTLLFLLSLYEFILAKEKTHWGWIVTLGISLGVSIQLHAILLVLFPATLFLASGIFMGRDWRVWKKLAIILVIAVILNLGQIISEQENGYTNTKIFLASATKSSVGESRSLFLRTMDDVSCSFQANTFMLSSVGSSDCDFTLVKAMAPKANKRIIKQISNFDFIFNASVVAVFSVLGYFLLIYFYFKEKERQRKYFLGLLLLYAILSFFVMLPILEAALRYFVHTFFVPLILLGLITDFLLHKFSTKFTMLVVVIVFLLLAWMNAISIKAVVSNAFADERIILGQVESMMDYMQTENGGQKEIRLFYSSRASNFFKSLRYVANERGLSLERMGNGDIVSNEKNVFYMDSGKVDVSETKIDDKNFDAYKIFNQVTIFHLKNQ